LSAPGAVIELAWPHMPGCHVLLCLHKARLGWSLPATEHVCKGGCTCCISSVTPMPSHYLAVFAIEYADGHVVSVDGHLGESFFKARWALVDLTKNTAFQGQERPCTRPTFSALRGGMFVSITIFLARGSVWCPCTTCCIVWLSPEVSQVAHWQAQSLVYPW
jgi:hypothetical protein